MKKIFLTLLLTLICSVVINAETYYVDGKNGDDTSGIGTQEKPFKTITKTIEILEKDDLVNWTNIKKGKLKFTDLVRIVLKQSDKKRDIKGIDRGTWKERIDYIEYSSERADIQLKKIYEYEIIDTEYQKSLRCINIEKKIIKLPEDK